MAEVRLSLDEAAGSLPPVCVCCGRVSALYVGEKLSWWPRRTWLFVFIPLAFVGLVIALKRLVFVNAPFCRIHNDYWLRRKQLVWHLWSFWLSSYALIMVVLNYTKQFYLDGDQNGAMAMFTGVFFPSCLVATGIVRRRGIYIRTMTPGTVVLANVSDAFLAAVNNRGCTPIHIDQVALDNVDVFESMNENAPASAAKCPSVDGGNPVIIESREPCEKISD